jgi:DNA-binding winged helix-turn-helix (wHTH) protein
LIRRRRRGRSPPPQERSKRQQARGRQAPPPTLSQRLNRMDAAHAPVPSMVIAGERPILVSTERNRSMSHALKLATLIPETEAPPRPKDRKVPPFVGSTMPSERLQLAEAPVLERFNPDPGFGVRGRVQSLHTDQLKPSKLAGATTSEVSFGPFRLLPAQFLLLDGDKPVPLGSRALEMLIVLLERPGELVTKQELMARVWPNLFVEPANLTVHISALRRRLRDGRDGNRFIINIPGRGYRFVAPVTLGRGT